MSEQKPNVSLTSTEVSNIWAAYMKNTMELRFFEYFYESTEDIDTKEILEKMLIHTRENVMKLKEVFLRENLIIPIGFTDQDVTINAKKLMSDTFTLFFCHDLTLLSLSTYPSAFSDCTRKDTRKFFEESLQFTIKIQNEITELLLSKGIFVKPPQVALENKIEIVDSKRYLSDLLSGHRSLNTAEIANLTRIIHRAQFSKMIFVAFSQLVKSKKLKRHLSKGRDEIVNVIDSLQGILEKENIPLSASGDFTIFDVEHPPFSDKLMLYFVNTCLGMFCFMMLGQAMNSCLRSDILLKLSSINAKFRKYYGEGLLITIEENWLEEPPQALDRKI